MAVVRLRSPGLRADCAKCCGLCCVGPAFDTDQGFGFDKPAHIPCAHLCNDFRCAIHEDLRGRGFPACATFDCYGAGQRVTQQLFGGMSWRSAPELATRMFSAYSRYRALHELMALLEVSIDMVSLHEASGLREVRRYIDEICDCGALAVEALSIDHLRRDVLDRVRAALVRDLV